MDALAGFLAAPPHRSCRDCRYARATAHDGLYCSRNAAAPYPCEVERASTTLEAWLYGACGHHGRFFDLAAGRAVKRI